MDRREFLRGAAGLSFAGLALLVEPTLRLMAPSNVALSAQVSVSGKILRGTHDGRILESLDGGRTWQVIAKLGDQCSILALREQEGQVQAQIGIRQGYRFALRSADGRVWRTIG